MSSARGRHPLYIIIAFRVVRNTGSYSLHLVPKPVHQLRNALRQGWSAVYADYSLRVVENIDANFV